MTDNDNNQSASAEAEEPVGTDVKESGAGDNSSVTEKQVKSPSKNNSKDGGGDAPVKEKEEDDHDHEEVEEDVTPKKVSLFEGPFVVEGKRERKKTARLTEDIDKELKSKLEKRDRQYAIPEGKGTKLGDIPYVNHVISHKLQSDDLNLLHRLFFSVVGSTTMRRSNIRKFCGFDFEEGTPNYERKLDFLSRVFVKDMKKYILFPLGLKGEKTKEDTAKIVLEYIMKPFDQKLEPPLSKKKKSEAKKRKRSKKSKGDKETKKKKEKKEGENEEVGSDSGSDSDDEDKDKGGDSDADSDKEEEPPKKKVKKSTPKKTPSKTPKKTDTPKKKKETKETKKKTPQKKASEKPKKKTTPKKEAKKPEDLSSLSSDSDSDDEPLTKKVKKSTPPTDDEVKDSVKRILDSSDLEDLSIRKVFQQVSAMYPDFDMSERQKFIKKTVKELIN